jgi:hypothetical protein
MGIESKNTVFERAKRVEALDHAATLISLKSTCRAKK